MTDAGEILLISVVAVAATLSFLAASPEGLVAVDRPQNTSTAPEERPSREKADATNTTASFTLANNKIADIVRYDMKAANGYRVMYSNVSGMFDGGFYHSPEFHVRTNQEGLRYRNFSLEPANDTMRFLAIGNSVTFGRGLNRSDRFTTLVEERFNQLYDTPVQIINAGIPGYGMKDYLLFLKNRGLDYQPDGIIIPTNTHDRFSIDMKLDLSHTAQKRVEEKYGNNISRDKRQRHLKEEREKVLRQIIERAGSRNLYIEDHMTDIASIADDNNLSVLFYITDNSRDRPGYWPNMTSYPNAAIISSPEELWTLPRDERIISKAETHPNARAHRILASGLMATMKTFFADELPSPTEAG